MSGIEKEPLTSVVTKLVTTTSGINMITRAPWPNGQYYRLRKVNIDTQADITSGGAVWKFWDQDLSSTTTAGRGSGTAPLFILSPGGVLTSGVMAASGFSCTTINRGFNETIRIPFFAGVTVQTNVTSIVNLELEIV